MTTRLRVLIVQSTPQDIQLVESVLARERIKGTDIICSSTLEDALDKLAADPFSIILLGWSLLDNAETRFAVRMLRESSGVPVLALCSFRRQGSGQLGPEFDESAQTLLARALATCIQDEQAFDDEQARDAAALSQLKVSEERYALAMEGVRDGIWDWDLGRHSVYYSRQWQDMLGLAPGDVSDAPEEWLGRVHLEDVALLQRSLADHLASRRAYFRCEYRIQHADGHYLWVLSRGGALWNEQGEPYRMVGSQIDVSRRKQLEEALAKEREQAEVILKSMGDAVITTDVEGRITDFNPEAEKLTGWTAKEAKKRPVSQVCKLIDRMTRQSLKSPSALALAQGAGISVSSHPTLISKQGNEIAIDDSVAPIRDKSGAVVGTVLVFRDVSIERNRAEQLAWQAAHDPLTGLANRQYFVEQLALASHQARCPHVVCYLDLDHFKIVNDTCGHAAGDELLRQVSALLSANIRQSDLLARLGGDEFGLIIYGCQPDSAYAIACKLCDIIQKFRFLWQGKVFSIGVSIGLVAVPLEGATTDKLMSLADAACYAAKNKGRNQVQVYSEDNEDWIQMSADFEWFARITQAIEDNSFCLYSQEIRPIDPNKEVIQELLLRLVDVKTNRLLPPMAFIPPAERYDLMPKLDRWTVRHCFKRLAGVSTPGVLHSINLSSDTLNDDSFVGFLEEMLAEFQLDPHRICFEITETAAIANLTQVASIMRRLKQLGFRFALDDFGSGMSSFVYLKQLPVDYLKIGGSLVSEINRDKVALATLKSINDISHIMGLATVAEYVCDSEILRTVQTLNIDYCQGFIIGKPRPFMPVNQPPTERSPEKIALNCH